MKQSMLWRARILALLIFPAFVPEAAANPRKESAEAVLAWNAIAADAVVAHSAAAPPGIPPYREARTFAMAFIAMHDSLNAIEPRYRRYECNTRATDASPSAAVAAAAHRVLVAAFPAQAARFDAAFASSMASEPESVRRQAGVALGQQCAGAILANRASDGADGAQVAYAPGTRPGDYQFTPPFHEKRFATDPLWGRVRPFVLDSGSQFRSAAPPGLSSTEYAADLNEVKTRGGMTGSNRTAEESQIALFWRENSPLAWNRVARAIALERDYDAWQLARLFALLQLAEADAYIASFDTKYYYNFWRPITAIRSASTDDNDATTADPAWTPYHPVTPPMPDYNSGHAAAGGAARVVLARFFGRDDIAFTLTSTSLPGVVRRYATLREAADENDLSRILVGYHFRRAVTAGRAQGESVGSWVADRALLPLE